MVEKIENCAMSDVRSRAYKVHDRNTMNTPNELAEDLSFVENIKKAQFGGCEQVHTLEIRPHSLCN